jgi:preprotein translocase subunit SecE
MKDKKQAAAPTSFGLMKYVHIMFLAGMVVVGWLLVMVVESLWTTLNLRFTAVPAPSLWMTLLIGGGASAVLTVYLWRHPRVNRLAVEIVTELSKVNWPTRKELSVSTVVVIVVSVIAAIILGLFDMFWSWFTTLILNL